MSLAFDVHLLFTFMMYIFLRTIICLYKINEFCLFIVCYYYYYYSSVFLHENMYFDNLSLWVYPSMLLVSWVKMYLFVFLIRFSLFFMNCPKYHSFIVFVYEMLKSMPIIINTKLPNAFIVDVVRFFLFHQFLTFFSAHSVESDDNIITKLLLTFMFICIIELSILYMRNSNETGQKSNQQKRIRN